MRAVQRDGHAVISVSDTGPGMAPEDTQRVFEPFYQASSGFPSDHSGSGLGLSICKQFVRLHGGQIRLESELGVGTTISFEVPISPPVEHTARPGHQIRPDWVWRASTFRTDRVVVADQLVRPRIVLCDESGALRSEFARYRDDIEVVETNSLHQLGRELRECPAHVVVVNAAAGDDLLSLTETVTQLAPVTPVIGCSVPSPIQRALDSGARGYLVKPVSTSDLNSVIGASGHPVKRVLAVDDDPEFLSLLRRLLYACDPELELTTLSDAKSVLAELRRGLPDLLLLDIAMPEMDGWRLLELVCQDERIRDVPIVVLSGQDPADQPPMCSHFVAAFSEGMSVSQLLRSAFDFSALMLEPSKARSRVPG